MSFSKEVSLMACACLGAILGGIIFRFYGLMLGAGIGAVLGSWFGREKFQRGK